MALGDEPTALTIQPRSASQMAFSPCPQPRSSALPGVIDEAQIGPGAVLAGRGWWGCKEVSNAQVDVVGCLLRVGCCGDGLREARAGERHEAVERRDGHRPLEEEQAGGGAEYRDADRRRAAHA